jgi:protein SCO1/2
MRRRKITVKRARSVGIRVALLSLVVCLPPTLSAAGGQEEHAAHERTQRQTFTESVSRYEIPDVTLLDSHGEAQPLLELLNTKGPVLLQFIFTTCSTICPVLSAAFAQASDGLAAVDGDYRMISISIDPEHDRPKILSEYAERYHASDRWHFLTGDADVVLAVQKAFDAYYPGNNKMYHRPYTYLRRAQDASWVRFDGLMGSAALVKRYREILETDSNQELASRKTN